MGASYPAKIQRPALSNIVNRDRLFDLIDQNSDQRVFWISGPGGAGKTTLINSYIEQRNLSCLWYQVDESDNDLAGFFYYLGLAGKFYSADPEVIFPSLTPEYTFGLQEFSRNFFTELAGILPSKCCLVLDNCQELSDNAELYQAILSGMSQLGSEFKIIFISRNELPSPFYRLSANNELCKVGWKELRLTFAEFEDFSKLKQLRLNTDQVKKLHALLDGWAAGFQIMAGADNYGSDIHASSEAILEDSKETIFNYFAEETFRHLDKTSQEVLLKTSLLPHIDLSILEQLNDSWEAERVIKELCRTNIFITKQIGHPGLYNYHQLFKAFLQNRYRAISADAEINNTLRAAAFLFISQGKTEEGISLHIQAGNWADAISHISANGPALLKQGRFKTLGSWLQKFPEHIARSNPWVKYWSATCLMLQEPDRAQALFDESLAMFQKQDDVMGMYLTLSGMGESLAYRFDSFVHYDQWIASLEKLYRQHPTFPSIEIEARIALVMMTAIGLRQPSYRGADEWRKRAMDLVNNNDLEDSIRIHLINALILERTLTGHLNDADVLLKIFKNSIENQIIPPIVLINLKNFEALLNWRRGRSEECSRAVAEGLTIAENTGVHVVSFILLANGVAADLTQGKLMQAESLLGQMEHQLDHAGSYGRLLYHFNMAWKYFLEGSTAKALAQCKQALFLCDSVGNPEATAVSHFAHAIVLLENGEFAESESELEKATAWCETHPIYQIAFACHVTKAELYFSSGKNTLGNEELQKGLQLGNKMGFNMFPIWRHGAISDLCVRALESEICEEYVQWLVEERNLFPSRPPVHLENWPWKVKIYCLGDFKICIDNEILRFKGKTQQKPIEFLKVLIALGGSNVSESKLSDILWPDADGDMQRQSFNTTLHRLRKILGVADILQLSSGKLSLNKERCWNDVWAFQYVLQNPPIYASSQHTSEEKAINLYQGAFLQNETAWWLDRTREKLQRQFLSAIEQAAQRYSAKNQWKKAADLYEKSLEIEPLTAEFYFQLMRCYANLGHKASAIKVHDKYIEKFRSEKDQVYNNIKNMYHQINGINLN